MNDDRIKILLVDDEPDALDLLESLLENKKGIVVVGKVNTKPAALEAMIKLKPDVIFQDIRMQDADGLEMIDAYRLHHFEGEIVFVTAHSEYAIEAIKKAAYDYLLKPVGIDELNELILRLLSDRRQSDDSDVQKLDKLKIHTRTGFTLLIKVEIVCCEADGNYTKITMQDGSQFTTSVNLGKLAGSLPMNIFFRLNRSVVINLNYLSNVNKGSKTCLLKFGSSDHTFRTSAKTIKQLEESL